VLIYKIFYLLNLFYIILLVYNLLAYAITSYLLYNERSGTFLKWYELSKVSNTISLKATRRHRKSRSHVSRTSHNKVCGLIRNRAPAHDSRSARALRY
jgi:hypothetical protein